MLSLLKIIDNHQRDEDTNHVNAIVRTGPRGTPWSVRALWCLRVPPAPLMSDGGD